MIHQLQSPSLPSAVAAEHAYLQIPSQPEWIAPSVEYLKDKAILCGACHETRSNKLVLALHEALTNSIIHGNLELSSDLKERCDNAFAEAVAERAADPRYGTRPVEVHFDYDGERCHWTFTDQGKGFDVARALARARQPDSEAMLASGRGILLMRAFLDDVRYELGGRRAILTLARASGEERRRAQPRAACTARIIVTTGEGCPPMFGFGRDLSRGGISFLTSTPLPMVNVILTLSQQDSQALRVRARIVRCHQLMSGIYDVAACFLDIAD